MGLSQQKVFVSWPVTSLGIQNPNVARSFTQGEVRTKTVWVDILQLSKVSTFRDYGTMAFDGVGLCFHFVKPYCLLNFMAWMALASMDSVVLRSGMLLWRVLSCHVNSENGTWTSSTLSGFSLLVVFLFLTQSHYVVLELVLELWRRASLEFRSAS